jgi:hypothetical protein
MSSTDTTPTAAATAPTVALTGLDAFFASLKADWQVLEADVISVIQNIGADVEVAAEDITYCLSWLGSHIGDIATTVTAVQSSVAALTAVGVPIPASLSAGISQINQAVAGVNEALGNQAVTANPGGALSAGYNATKALQVAAASAAAIAATIQAATAPAPAATQ